MERINKKVLIILICLIVGITICFTCYIIFSKSSKDNNGFNNSIKEEVVGDIVFSYIDKSVYIKDAIPTLDKFGVMNDAFSFSIKNNSNNEVSYQLKLLDDDSTIQNKDIRYELTKNNEVVGIYTLADDGVIDVSNISKLGEVKYAIKFWLNYNSEYLIGTFKKKISVELGDNTNTVNEPVLTKGMIPVYYDKENNGWYKADMKNNYNSKWYNYSDQEWANAVTIKNNKREFYEKSDVGTKINMEDINSFWVWIPRFNYELKNNDIDIKFVKEQEPAYRSFSFNNEEIAGFWISKFESGIESDSLCIKSSLTKDCNNSNNKLYFVPDYYFTNRVTMANLFYSIRKMELNNNIYGFSGAGTKLNNDGTITGDKNNLDIHMIKNSEWQAVALLSDSKYGKRGNNDYQDKDKLIYNNNSNYTGKSFVNDYLYDYNTPLKGEGASTTGNTTGVYDMAGGKRELVMIDNSQINLFSNKSNSGFSSKVKDYYYDNDFGTDTTLQFKDRYSSDNIINNEPITRGGYKNTGNIFNVNSVSDYIDKISLETNSRASIVIIKEN